jgi:hypothetical protein
MSKQDHRLPPLRQEPLTAGPIPAITDVPNLQEREEFLKEPAGKMQPEILMPRNNPKNRGDLPV